MKKVLFSLFLLVFSAVSVWAETLVATLQHGSTMTMYTTNNALKQAYADAQDGDVITLSPGTFLVQTAIGKSIRIVGTYGIDNSNTDATILTSSEATITADNVYIEGIYFLSSVKFGANIKNATLKRCYIPQTNAGDVEHYNTLIDECVLINENAVAKGKDYNIKNSTLQSFINSNDAQHRVYVTNCYISYFYSSNVSSAQPYGVYKNNVLRLHSTTTYNASYSVSLNANSEFHYNYFYKTKNSSYTITFNVTYASASQNDHNTVASEVKSSTSDPFTFPNTKNYEFKGQDGTNIGITGGTGFSKWPGIPRVVSATIDGSTDDKGKLNASFTVSPQK